MKTKLAVLISGSYRNFDSTWIINEEILRRSRIPYEVFFHTWDINPSFESDVLISEYKNRFFFDFRKPKFVSFPEQISLNEIQSKYQFNHVKVEKFGKDAICRLFNLDTSISNFLLQSQISSCGMYLGIERLRALLETEENFTHFLRLRTDFVLDANFVGQLFEHDLVFCGQLLPTPDGLIGDQCFGGKLARCSDVLLTLDQLEKFTSSSEWFNNRRQTLAENIIRLTLKPLRSSTEIVFLEGIGFIKRPDIVYESLSKQPLYLFVIVFHNLKVLYRKIIRKIF